MAAEWGNESVLKFLDLYEREAVIWNSKHSGHRDKKQMNEAWSRISIELGKSVIDLKRKKESLMATFRLILRKKKMSMAPGKEQYEPTWFAFRKMESFLADNYEYEIEEFEKNTNDFSQPSSTDFDSIEDVAASNMYDQRSSKRCRISENPLESKQNFEAFGIQTQLSALYSEDDECALFGKLVAKRLERFSVSQRDEIMYEIGGIFLRKTRELFSHLNARDHPTSTSSFSFTSSEDVGVPAPNQLISSGSLLPQQNSSVSPLNISQTVLQQPLQNNGLSSTQKPLIIKEESEDGFD